jgi:hypothetical protein
VPANPDQPGPVAVPDPAPAAQDKPAAEVVRLDKFRKK